ncbi:acidic mammalian chitinase-like isoform X4 [Biomphalaria glabrata]|uniref:Acidic mammalian chitinase-like isoform X4 n=1 Tax=Biomphalaria glabrata TaxID=6526 RepID=A0A9W3ARB8_BIOGL|nr:acidic mammalian chitinase-like isoform X4 [Biomphalaria glabrata]
MEQWKTWPSNKKKKLHKYFSTSWVATMIRNICTIKFTGLPAKKKKSSCFKVRKPVTLKMRASPNVIPVIVLGMKSEIAISFLSICFVLLTLIKQGSGQCKMLLCRFRPIISAQSGLTTSHLNSNLCPYIIMALSEYIDNDVISVERKVTDTYSWMFQAKRENSDLKFILAFYSYLGNRKFYEMYQSPARRRNFIQSCIRHLRDNQFHGMTVELLFGAGMRTPQHYSRDRFADFMQDIQNAFTEEARQSGKPKLLLFGDLHSKLTYVAEDFDVPRIYSYSDYVIFHAPWRGKMFWTGENGLDRLHPNRIYRIDPEDTLNLDYFVKQIVSIGAIKSKTIVHVNLLSAKYYNGVPPIIEAQFSFASFIDYGEVCNMVRKGGQIRRASNIHPYHLYNRYLVFFDDELSVRERQMTLKKIAG